MKVLINSEGLKNHFNPLINDSIEKLNTAITTCEGLEIPVGFSYKSYLNSLAETLKENRNNCVIIRDFVANSIVDFNYSTNEITDLFNNMDIIKIKDRTSIIKE